MTTTSLLKHPWKPSASLTTLQARARLYQMIRLFFSQRNVLEVDVPILSQAATVDPFIDSLSTLMMGDTYYLQTSPEFFMKRLLAAYQQDMYYLGKAFRQGEQGQRHAPEFTMLEWYRVGWDDRQLINEVKELIQHCLPEVSYQAFSYKELFQQQLSLDPHNVSVDELKKLAHHRLDTVLDSNDKNTWLDLLFSHCIEPQLPDALVCVFDFPESQAALARIEHNLGQQKVARRFEMYVNRMELVNGYWELRDANEQERRFKADVTYRRRYELPELPYDQALVSALNEGYFPECAGVALGIDRLLMCCLQTQNIQDVLSFPCQPC
ncbi:EF-P lysine aminoacylase GenX [Candidatus Endobugula sertula]|uniref:EF-P lysine aminoacylase GenX n=1 Tax=Candidatus Endobugula sertula TaxID=62101 RepID=A0A1D2QRY0_9GAMM|nr:EF-P lysine aminoacylase GenX [Candidatus Endobugula sertula]